MNPEILEQVPRFLTNVHSAFETFRSAMDTPEELVGWVALGGLPLVLVATGYSLYRFYRETQNNVKPVQQISLDPPNYHPNNIT